MYLKNIIIGICSILFFMVGIDKFMGFLEPPCSLMDNITPSIWKTLGVLQIGAGVLIWSSKFRKYVTGFFFVFMVVFSIIHLSQSTYDIGGSSFMAILLGILYWNPSFLNRTKS